MSKSTRVLGAVLGLYQNELDIHCTREGEPWQSCKNCRICRFILTPEQYAEQLKKCKVTGTELAS